MLVSLLSDNLSKKISFINHAVSSRPQLPILSNLLLEAKNGSLVISATDLEIGIITSVPASVEKEGKVTIPARNFVDLLSNIGSKKITLEKEGSVLKLKGEKVKASFPTSPPEEFPNLYTQKGVKYLTLIKEDVEKFIARISFCAAMDSGRPALSGILFEGSKTGINLVSTDSYRLSYQKTPLKADKDLQKPVVIPARIIREMVFLKDDGDLDFFVSSESNQIVISQGETILVGRLIDAEYPPYGKIIPTDFGTKTQFSREDLLSAIKICSVFARETANIIKLSVEKEKIVVSANDSVAGDDQVEVDAKTTGENNEIAFNAKYLVDVLSTLSEEELTFEMNGPLNPGVFRIKDDPSFLHLIMPIRVQE